VSPPRANEYVWAEIGALVGAVLVLPFAAAVFGAVFVGVGFERLEDLTRTGIISFAAGTFALIVGSAIGCGFALRKTGYPLANGAARLHFLLLFVFLVAAVGFTSEERDSIAVEATVVPLVMPLFATWVTGLAPNNARIQTFVLLLLAVAGYGVFSRSSSVSFVLPEPPRPTKGPAPSQLPLGSKNECWAGIYPGALDLPEWEHIPASDFLVDPETNDTYEAVCVDVQLSAYNAYWPPDVAERLVRASDLQDSDTPQTRPGPL
jgi:hypothetical protein